MSNLTWLILALCGGGFTFAVFVAIAHTFRDDRPTPWDGGPPL